MSTSFDYIIVGSGINSLCCAALLAKKGHKVCVLERNDYFGGCIKTEELTLPGYYHDVLSGFHPLFVTSPGYAVLKEDLARHGLEYLNTSKPTASITSDKEVCILTRSRQENIKNFNKLSSGDGQRYARTMADMEADAEFTFALLGMELQRFSVLWLLFKELIKRKVSGLLDFFGSSMMSSHDWLNQFFRSKQIHALLAPWVLHTGLGPEATFSGAMNRVIAFTLEAVGMPIVKGGSDKLVYAFEQIIKEKAGVLRKNTHVTQVLVENGVAKGVLTANDQIHARKAVICNVTPDQLYGRLLDSQWVPEKVREESSHYRFGRADMQIHLALDRPPLWLDKELQEVAMIHLADDTHSVSKAVNEAERGLLPERATVVIGQPTALDPGRAPEGKAILWIQLQELPSVIKGDAAGLIDIPESGEWTDQVKEAYADRIIARLSEYTHDLPGSILSRKVLSPKDLQAININLVGGDPYSGHCGMQQFFLWRPIRSLKNHETSVKKLYQIGASTHPGPGLGGNSGYMVAELLG